LQRKKKAGLNPDPFLLRTSGQSFYNTSELDLRKLIGDQDNIGQNLYAYIQAFSPVVRDIFERFSFSTQIDKLAKSGLLYLVTEKFAGIDLHPEAVDNHEMGLAFEELIRKFAELSNETAGEHFTPRENPLDGQSVVRRGRRRFCQSPAWYAPSMTPPPPPQQRRAPIYRAPANSIPVPTKS
jgi:hypothetical protein